MNVLLEGGAARLVPRPHSQLFLHKINKCRGVKPGHEAIRLPKVIRDHSVLAGVHNDVIMMSL